MNCNLNYDNGLLGSVQKRADSAGRGCPNPAHSKERPVFRKASCWFAPGRQITSEPLQYPARYRCFHILEPYQFEFGGPGDWVAEVSHAWWMPMLTDSQYNPGHQAAGEPRCMATLPTCCYTSSQGELSAIQATPLGEHSWRLVSHLSWMLLCTFCLCWFYFKKIFLSGLHTETWAQCRTWTHDSEIKTRMLN